MNERGDREPPREVPVRDARYDDIPRPLVTSVGKVIAWLITVLAAVVTIEGWLLSNRYEVIVESRFDRFELRLSQEYAKQKDVMPRTEYDLKHAELIERDRQLNERIMNLEQRAIDLTNRVGKLEAKR